VIIEGERIWINGQFMPAQLEISEGKIVRIGGIKEKVADIDYGTKRILPGFIDIHTHGAYGYDTNDGEPEGLLNWMKKIPEEGVTSILPTTVTQLPPVLTKAVENVANVIEGGYEGAEILGIHFEGPYLDMQYKGAQPPEAIAPPTIEEFKSYQKAAKGWIRYITISPEHDENFSLIRYCRASGVAVSMGHSSATYEQALLAAANGAVSMTHVYNGMTPFLHRSPGLVGTALRIKTLYGEIIGDGCHSEPAALHIFFAAKGEEKGILVTDSLRAKHCPPGGDYQLGGHDITISEEGLAYLKGTNTIAGSTLSMNKGLKILIEKAEVSQVAAINACTINPATCIGVQNRKGKLCAGYDADIVVLEDDYSVVQTYCRGKACL
jgi:N-acetylglucosamine-6-phosphate deacetylase